MANFLQRYPGINFLSLGYNRKYDDYERVVDDFAVWKGIRFTISLDSFSLTFKVHLNFLHHPRSPTLLHSYADF